MHIGKELIGIYARVYRLDGSLHAFPWTQLDVFLPEPQSLRLYSYEAQNRYVQVSGKYFRLKRLVVEVEMTMSGHEVENTRLLDFIPWTSASPMSYPDDQLKSNYIPPRSLSPENHRISHISKESRKRPTSGVDMYRFQAEAESKLYKARQVSKESSLLRTIRSTRRQEKAMQRSSRVRSRRSPPTKAPSTRRSTSGREAVVWGKGPHDLSFSPASDANQGQSRGYCQSVRAEAGDFPSSPRRWSCPLSHRR